MRGFQFVSKMFLLYAVVLCYTSAEGQSSGLALKNLQRQKWQRAYELLTKATSKDSLNVTAKYVFAQYFFSGDNPAFNLDSAYRHVMGALNDFESSTKKERDKLARFPVDSLLLHHLKEQIEQTAFGESKHIRTEQSWINFIDKFPTSAYIPNAKQQRDSLAFEFARRENTYIAFHDFLKKYPEAVQFKAAEAIYEKLLLEAKTADQTLESFERFLNDYPSSHYRSFVEQTIFEYLTASADYNHLVNFIRNYPDNPFAGKAKNILFHLISENERTSKWPAEFTSDSLAEVMSLEESYLVPFFKNKKYGFMNSEGAEVIGPELDSLHGWYFCGNVDDDFISLPSKVIARTGTCIWNSGVKKIDDIGFGFLILDNDECKSVVHKSGFQVGPDCIDEATILNGRFAALRAHNKWSLFTLSGRLLKNDLDNVFCIKDVVCFKRNNVMTLATASSLAALPANSATEPIEYDEVRPWDNNLIFVRKQHQSGLLDQNLKTVVPLSETTLTAGFFGVISSSPSGIKLYSADDSITFKNFVAREPWLAVKDSVWRLVDPRSFANLSSPFDTIVFFGPFPAGERADSSFIFFNRSTLWKGPKPNSIEFIQGRDSSYLSIEQKGRKSLYNHRGQKLFTGAFDKIQFVANGLFIVYRNDKKGLITSTGKLLLPFAYDAIGMANDGTLSLLKSSKFGLYDYVRKKQIHPSYAKNLVRYNEKVITASREGLYGFIDWDNKPISKFEFKEVRYWNDTTALVKKETWMLYEIKTASILLDKIKDFTMIRDEQNEKLAIVYQDTDHGVLHSRNGTIIPISYSDIINVGSAEKPLYFTEKHVEEASLFVVIYYNAQGEALRKEIYDPEDYDKIYCNAN
jgi:hypothetical protein